jgi:hypothetical protein
MQTNAAASPRAGQHLVLVQGAVRATRAVAIAWRRSHRRSWPSRADQEVVTQGAATGVLAAAPEVRS